jgi:hypothetical protein
MSLSKPGQASHMPMLEALLSLLLLFPASGCAAQMLNSPTGAASSRYAPVRRASQEVGIVKYSADGAAFIVQQRKNDAYKQMYETCSGSYEIVREYLVKDGAAATAIDSPLFNSSITSAVAQPLSSWVIEFKCVAQGVVAEPFTYDQNAPKLKDGRPCPSGTTVGEVGLQDSRLQSEACVLVRDGRTLHGPYLVWWRTTRFQQTIGTYRSGQPDGEWVTALEDGTPESRTMWRGGAIIGKEYLAEPKTFDECRSRGGQWVPFANRCNLPK